jgi:hypothetical protein
LFPCGQRTVQARWADRPQLCQRGLSLPYYGGPSGPSRRTVRVREIEFGQGRCVFGTLYYGLFGIFIWTVSGPCADRLLILLRLIKLSVTQVCQVPERPASVGGPSDLDFSDNSDRFQTIDIAITGTVDRPALGRGPSACTQNLCKLHITATYG